jgi:hypothetical protein
VRIKLCREPKQVTETSLERIMIKHKNKYCNYVGFFSIFGQNAVGRPIIAARKIHFTVHGKQSDTKVSQVSKPYCIVIVIVFITFHRSLQKDVEIVIIK